MTEPVPAPTAVAGDGSSSSSGNTVPAYCTLPFTLHKTGATYPPPPLYRQRDVFDAQPAPKNPRNLQYLPPKYTWYEHCYLWNDRPWNANSYLSSDFPDNIYMPDKKQYGFFYKRQKDPRYRTTNNHYGFVPPAPWHVPLQLMPREQEFTTWHRGHPHGNYRNMSMNHAWHPQLFDDYASEYRIREYEHETHKLRQQRQKYQHRLQQQSH